MDAMEIIVTMATERVIHISQYKAAAVSYLIVKLHSEITQQLTFNENAAILNLVFDELTLFHINPASRLVE